MVTGCEEDRENIFYDEYGGGVSGEKMSDQQPASTCESIMSLAKFAGGEEEDTTPMAPSQGNSDTKEIEEPTEDIKIKVASNTTAGCVISEVMMS